jgi:hypothetical protein
MNTPYSYSIPAREAEKLCREQEQLLRRSVADHQAKAFQYLQNLKSALKLQPKPSIFKRILVWFELSTIHRLAGTGKPDLTAWETALNDLNFEGWSFIEEQHPPAISGFNYCDENVRVAYTAFYEAFILLVEKWDKWSNKSEVLEQIERLPNGSFYNCN